MASSPAQCTHQPITGEQFRSALLRCEFGAFLRFAFAELNGGRVFRHNWHIDAIEHQLDRLRSGRTRRLIVTLPPRHLKSVMISSAWVAWMLGLDPSRRFICVSYGYDLAGKHAHDCLTIMDTDWYRQAFPKVHLVRRSVHDFETSAGGGRLSTSVNGVLTGRGADFIVVDDPMKADDALSEARREDVKMWQSGTLNSRLDDQENGRIVLVMQRLHEADLAGELLRQGGWDELRLPSIATKDELVPLTGGRFHQRREGRALHPAWRSLAWLEQERVKDSYVFAAQHQQDPVSRTGAFVQAEYFGTYDLVPNTGIVVQSWDTAIKTTVRSDWSVGITAIFHQGRFYIIDVFRKRVEFGELMQALCASCRQHRVDRLLIEDAASGQQLIQELRRTAPSGVVLPIPVRSTQEKITRFEAQASRIQAGTVVLPRTAPWLAEFVNELVKFPGGSHDDQADALAQMLANQPSTRVVAIAGPEIIDADELDFCDNPMDDDPW